MSSGFDAPKELPPETPKTFRRVYAVLFFAVASLVLLSIGIEKAQSLPDAIVGICRSIRVCGPPPLKPMPPLRTPMLPSGSNAQEAARPTLERYQRENPDYEITFTPDPARERNSCKDALIKIDCKYGYEGTFSGKPKWRGLIERLGF